MEQKKKKEPWRIVVFVLAVAYILWMQVKNDIAGTLVGVPKEQVLPMLVTGVAVTLLKVALLAGIVLLLKWIAGKLHRE
jgi:hypothetical protein